MNIKKAGIIAGSVLGAAYVLFLTVPFALTGLVNSYNAQICNIVKESTGLNLELGKIRILTTPKLTAGAGVDSINLKLPTGEEVLAVKGARAKVSLLPFLIGRIEADVLNADSITASLKMRPDGHLLIEEYLVQEKSDTNEVSTPMTKLPLGLKLSNHLPDIRVGSYDLALIDMRNNKNYSINGKDLKVTDFILNKKVKISTTGSVKLVEEVPFTYNIKLLNKIMPDIELNDLVFAQNNNETVESEPITFNVIDIFEGIRKNQLSANLTTNLKTSGKLDDMLFDGLFDVENLTLAVNGKKLPEGHVKIDFSGKKAVSDIALYTAENEETTVLSEYKGGKSKKLNLSVKSKAQINNIFNIIKSIASSFDYNDLETLSATGAIDADFNFKSNMKKVTSDGYLKIPSGSIKYTLYNILINNINADVDLSNDTVNLKKLGFTILNQPLKAYGTIKSDATADLHLTADKLLIKGLLAAAGQVGLLKENDIKSGTLTMDASATGSLKKLKPVVDLAIDNVNVLNKPSSTTVKLTNSKVNLSSDGKTYKGTVDANAIKVINPALSVTLPKASVNLDQKDVNIADTYLMLDNSRIDITGKISDYTTKNFAMNIKAKGSLKANDLRNIIPADMRSMFTAKGSMPLLVVVTGNDKKQIVDAQVLATPSGYLHVMDLSSISGKNALFRANAALSGNNLKLADTGLYLSGKSSLDESGSVSGLTQLVKVGGDVDIAGMTLDNLKVNTLSAQTISIPGYKNSKASVNADLTLNGDAMSPSIKGKAALSEVSLPTMKTSLKNITADFGGKTIDVNLPLITVDNSSMNAKAVASSNFTNGLVIKSVDFKADLIDADTLTAAMAGATSSSSGSSSASSSALGNTQNVGIVIQSGKASVTKFKTGKIVATSLTSDFGLKNNVFYLKNLKGDAFSGKISGDINCNIVSGSTSVDMTGSGMKAVDAIEASAGIKNALSGTLGFGSKLKLNAFASSYNAMLKSITGEVTFDVKDGHYANIGSLDQLLLAQNLAANAVLKAALAPIRNMTVVQNASNFSSLTGSLTLADGIATLKSVKSTGPSMAYFVTGKYNLINGYTNVIVLGRLGADVVAVLGPLGELSASKLLSYIPKFGTKTASVLSSLTSNPENENTSQIPALTGESTNSKDFKVLFNGSVTSTSSIKSFKWLTTCDTSAITGGSLKEQLKTSTDALKTTGKTSVQEVKKNVETAKQTAKDTVSDVKNQVQKTKDSIQDLKNLKNMFKKSTSGSTVTEEASSTAE